jgi:hypothetical protein
MKMRKKVLWLSLTDTRSNGRNNRDSPKVL